MYTLHLTQISHLIFLFKAHNVCRLLAFIFCIVFPILQAHHLRCLNDFVEAQSTYYAQCYQYMVDLQKQLGRWELIKSL